MSKEKKQIPDYANIIPDKLKIIKQYLTEKDYAIKLRQVKINSWILNEEAYNGVTKKTLITRSNLHIPVVFEGVHNASSKLGDAPEFNYDTIPEEDKNSNEIMKHIVMEDLKQSEWDLVYEQSKIEGGIYGRTIYEVIPGNDKNRVILLDTLSFLISPIAKTCREALYQGRQFIYKTIEQIEEEKEKMEYDEEEIAKLKENKVPNEVQSDSTSEASLKNIRMANMGLANVTNYGSKVAEITEWWTYLSDKKKTKSELYCLTVANDVYLLRCKKASELGLKRPPFVSWGYYQRGITFWCPSVADIYRDPNLLIDCNINQQIDNNTYRNFGMWFVRSSSGLKQSSIVPRPLGVTPVQVDPQRALKDDVMPFEVPEITTASQVINLVKGFADAGAGLSPNLTSQPGKKLSVTQQARLQAEVETKVNMMKKNATLACQELYQMMAEITASNLTKPRSIKIFGYKNLDIEDVTKKNFIYNGKKIKFIAKATPSENAADNKAIKQKSVATLYELFKDDPKVPGQLALRRSVTKRFDIPATEAEEWFSQEQQAPQTPPVIAPNAPATQPQPPSGNQPPPTPETPLNSQTNQMVKANIAPALKA